MYTGEDKILQFSIVDDSGVSKILTGGSAVFIVGNIIKTTNLNGGIIIDGSDILVTLSPEDTAGLPKSRLEYELRAVDALGLSEVVAYGMIDLKKSKTII